MLLVKINEAFALTLPLLMARLGTANHPHRTFATDQFAVPAHFLN